MQVVTAADMRAIDGRAIQEYGVPELVLMEHAGLAVARRAWAMVNGSARRRVVVFVGKGNNGGDGCVAARHLHNWGAAVRVFVTDSPDKAREQCARQLDMVERLGIDIVVLGKQTERKARFHTVSADLLIDSLLGTGSRGAPRGAVKLAIDMINEADTPVLAADIPSGVDADTGAVPGVAVRADQTVTFGLPKVGLLIGPGRDLAGRWTVADIGLPRVLLAGGRVQHVSRELVRAMLPSRPPGGHKGTFGRVVVVGGSKGMAGAAMLAAQGAQRIGPGLVMLSGPEELHDVFAIGVPEAISHPLPQVNGTVASTAAERVLSTLDRASVLVIGPGLGRTEDVRALVTRVLAGAREAGVPVVVDADGLNALADAGVLREWAKQAAAGAGDSTDDRGPGLVLTPHPGEMARLCGVSAAEIVARPLQFAVEHARAWRTVVVLKGSPTVIAHPAGNAFINSTGSAALASGGTGDVLAGAIGGLIAQGALPLEAAVAAVYVHGAAGDLDLDESERQASPRPHRVGLTASDLARRLPHVVNRLREN